MFWEAGMARGRPLRNLGKEYPGPFIYPFITFYSGDLGGAAWDPIGARQGLRDEKTLAQIPEQQKIEIFRSD